MNTTEFFASLYNAFNARDIDTVIGHMTENVKWANGLEGGFVYGHAGVRAYWTRQFKLMSAIVTPETIENNNGSIEIKVHQVVHDLDGNLLADEFVMHNFDLDGEKIAEFT